MTVDYRGTYEQHGDRVLRLTNSLHKELGAQRGDRFALMATNSHQYLEAYHAAYLGAGVVNPLNLRLAGKELAYIVQNSGCEVAFVDASFAEHFHRSMEESEGENPVRHTVLIGDGDVPHDIDYEDLLGAGDPVVPDEPEEDDPVDAHVHGRAPPVCPRECCSTTVPRCLNLYHIASQMRLNAEAVFLHQTPMFHAGIDGRHPRKSRGGRHVGVHPDLRPRRRSRPDRDASRSRRR